MDFQNIQWILIAQCFRPLIGLRAQGGRPSPACDRRAEEVEDLRGGGAGPVHGGPVARDGRDDRDARRSRGGDRKHHFPILHTSDVLQKCDFSPDPPRITFYFFLKWSNQRLPRAGLPRPHLDQHRVSKNPIQIPVRFSRCVPPLPPAPRDLLVHHGRFRGGPHPPTTGYFLRSLISSKYICLLRRFFLISAFFDGCIFLTLPIIPFFVLSGLLFESLCFVYFSPTQCKTWCNPHRFCLYGSDHRFSHFFSLAIGTSIASSLPVNAILWCL